MSSRLNDLTICWRCFNVDVMMLYISGRDHAIYVKIQQLHVHVCSSAILKENVSILLRLSDPVRCSRWRLLLLSMDARPIFQLWNILGC